MTVRLKLTFIEIENADFPCDHCAGDYCDFYCESAALGLCAVCFETIRIQEMSKAVRG